MGRKKTIDRYRCAKCPACGRMMEKANAYSLWDEKDLIIHGTPMKPLTVWICLKCNKVYHEPA